MRIKSALCCIGLGVVGTIMYQELKNGNLKKMVKKMDKAKTKIIEDMENSI